MGSIPIHPRQFGGRDSQDDSHSSGRRRMQTVGGGSSRTVLPETVDSVSGVAVLAGH